jgi:hypothetical protein
MSKALLSVLAVQCENSDRKLGKGKAIPLQALTGPEGSRRLRLPHFKTIATWRWQGCQPYAPAAFTPGNIPGAHFCYRLRVDPRAIVRQVGLCQWKIPMTPSRIDPATCRFEAQWLNHSATARPPTEKRDVILSRPEVAKHNDTTYNNIRRYVPMNISIPKSKIICPFYSVN